MATQKLKVEYRLKNKIWTTPQIKTHENSHELKTDQTTDMTQKSSTHACKVTQLTLSLEKIVKLHGFKFMNQGI
jgi:hypothetical protein